MKQITNIRKAVCVMANQLKKAGYSLSGVELGEGWELSGMYSIKSPG